MWTAAWVSRGVKASWIYLMVLLPAGGVVALVLLFVLVGVSYVGRLWGAVGRLGPIMSYVRWL
jgi:hypothetical protein